MMFAIALIATVAVAQAAQFNIKNNHGGEIWVGIQGASNQQHLANGGFSLAKGADRTIDAPNTWSGRFWARTWCDGGSNRCQSGDCGGRECQGRGGEPPATWVEITLNPNGKDFYDISLVDGFNSQASIEPVNGNKQGDNSKYSCTQAGCHNYNILTQCPEDHKKYGNNGQVVGCKSECMVHQSEQNCCSGSHNTPQTCPAPGFSKFFKERCPDAYSYPYDDHTSTFTCRASRYNIVFGS